MRGINGLFTAEMHLNLGQMSHLSSEKPNLVSYVHVKFDVWLSYVRLNEFGSSNMFYPSASDG